MMSISAKNREHASFLIWTKRDMKLFWRFFQRVQVINLLMVFNQQKLDPIPFGDGLSYVTGIKGAIPTVFKRTFEEQNSGKAVFKQLPNVIEDFWTTKPHIVIVSAQVAERRQRILEKIHTTMPFQKVLVASKELNSEPEYFDFGE